MPPVTPFARLKTNYLLLESNYGEIFTEEKIVTDECFKKNTEF